MKSEDFFKILKDNPFTKNYINSNFDDDIKELINKNLYNNQQANAFKKTRTKNVRLMISSHDANMTTNVSRETATEVVKNHLTQSREFVIVEGDWTIYHLDERLYIGIYHINHGDTDNLDVIIFHVPTDMKQPLKDIADEKYFNTKSDSMVIYDRVIQYIEPQS